MSTATISAYRFDRDTLLRRQDLTIDCMARGIEGPDGYWIPGPLFWMNTLTQTFDPHYLDKGLASPHRTFPQMPYMSWLFSRLLTESIVFIPKSREMLLSWAVIGYCVWRCQIFPGTQVLVQSQKHDKACELVKGTEPPGYAYTLYDRQDSWLKKRYPLAMRAEDLPADNVVWANHSEIQAIGRGADQVRQYHPTVYVVDEMAFMEEAAASFGAATPVAKQIICVSSAGPGFFGDICSED
jgi:hypothetical protein